MSSAFLPRVKSARHRVVEANLKLKVKKSLFESDKVVFPEHVLNEIMREFPVALPTPTIFEIMPIVKKKRDLSTGTPLLHCGVLEYSCADRECVEVPYWMLRVLGAKEDDKWRFRLKRRLPKCTFARVRPLQRLMAKVMATPKQTLEYALRLFTCLTIGQIIPIVFEGHVFTLLVEAIDPMPCGTLIDTHLSLDFEPFDELVAARYSAVTAQASATSVAMASTSLPMAADIGDLELTKAATAISPPTEELRKKSEEDTGTGEDVHMSAPKSLSSLKKSTMSSVMKDALIKMSEISMYRTEGGTIEVNAASDLSADPLLKSKAHYFRCKVPNPNFAVRIELEVSCGDCLLYVDTKTDKPSATHHRWKEDSDSAKKRLLLAASDHSATDESKAVSISTMSTWLYIAVFPFVMPAADDECDSKCVEEGSSEELVTKHVFGLYIDQLETASADASSEDGTGTVSKKEASGMRATTSGTLERDESTHTLCGNCGRWISKGAYMMHEMQCARLNVRCETCGQSVAKSAIGKHKHCAHFKDAEWKCAEVFESDYAAKRHAVLRHGRVPCDLCDERMLASLIGAHQKHECLMRFVLCKWCAMAVRFAARMEHERYCGASTVDCQMCGELCRRSRLEHHLAAEHNLNPTTQATLVSGIVTSTLGTADDAAMLGGGVLGGGGDALAGGGHFGGVDLADGVFDDDAVVTGLKRELSELSAFGDDAPADVELWDFVCPFCQKHPPKTEVFEDHMAACGEEIMSG